MIGAAHVNVNSFGQVIRRIWDWGEPSEFWLTRALWRRALAINYCIAFLIAANQFIPLVGRDGLEPYRLWLPRLSFWQAPSLLHLNYSDGFATVLIWMGLGLSLLALAGIADKFASWISALVWFALWAIYFSLVTAGGTFYGFGWETLLLECGFLTIFLGSSKTKPPPVIFWLLIFVLFRLMFGAGLIKIRGDEVWRDLTALFYHYETQPLPNPLSWFFHHFPQWLHKAGVLFNHFVELIVPWFLFAPRKIRYWAGGLTALFQFVLILSGNLSWLNYITIFICIACFDDRFWARLTPKFLWRHLVPEVRPTRLPLLHRVVVGALTAVILWLSVKPTLNLFPPALHNLWPERYPPVQLMNASFDRFRIVNTYGAFGTVGRERYEIIVEGTDSAIPDQFAMWREYEFKGKPGDPRRRPCIVSPYHYKLDWQMWFAAMTPFNQQPWFVNLVSKLLQNDARTLSLMAHNPFPDQPPRYIRARLLRYKFTDSLADGWWKREVDLKRGEIYLPPLSLDNPEFRRILKEQRWME
jgi:hypothetical protein